MFPVASGILCNPAAVESVFSASGELQGEREIAHYYAITKHICLKVQSNAVMHTLIMLMLTLSYTLELLKLELSN